MPRGNLVRQATEPSAASSGGDAGPLERHGYAPPAARRPVALACTGLIVALAMMGLFLTFDRNRYPTAKPAAPLIVSLLPLASPPETPPERRVEPRPVEPAEPAPPVQPRPIVDPVVPLPSIAPVPAPPAKPAEPTPPEPVAAAPRTMPAPVAQQMANDAPDSWEGRVLARLERYKRYPGVARAARQQGVVFIRFRMRRDGHVLWSTLERGSGFPMLDRAALDTLRRADPLPPIPRDRPDEIELAVPVEFFLR